MNVRGEILWCVLLLPFAAGCVGPHVPGHAEASAAIGICFDTGAEARIREEVAEQLARQDVEIVGCLSSDAQMLEWQRPKQFEGVRAAKPLPGHTEGARFGYSFDRGPMHVTVIETAQPVSAGSEAYHWLMEDLSLATGPWKVVFLSRPILSPCPIHVDRTRLDLAELLTREHVALAIATGGPAYFRTAPIGESRPESVCYVLLGGPSDPESSGRTGGPNAPTTPPPDWIARTITEPCFCVLDVTDKRLRWAARDLQGRLLDLLDVPVDKRFAIQPTTESLEFADQGVRPSDEVPNPARTFTWSEIVRSAEWK